MRKEAQCKFSVCSYRQFVNGQILTASQLYSCISQLYFGTALKQILSVFLSPVCRWADSNSFSTVFLYFSTVFLNCTSQLYFSNVFLNCISQLCLLTIFFNYFSQLYFSTVFLNCIFQIYFSTVFLGCISQLYFATALKQILSVFLSPVCQ